MSKMALVGLCGVCLWGPVAAGADKTFTASGTILPGEVWDHVHIQGDGTVVNMSGGSMIGIRLDDASHLDMTDGSLSGDLNVYDTATVDIAGGQIGYDVNVHGPGMVSPPRWPCWPSAGLH